MVVVTNSGKLYSTSLEGSWHLEYEDDRLRNYSILEASPDRRRVAIGTLTGAVVVLCLVAESGRLAVEAEAEEVPGKVFALQWVSDGHVLALSGGGVMTTWEILAGGTMRAVSTHHLPVSMHRWLCAVYVTCADTSTATATTAPATPEHLICGDRAGSLHLYSLTDPKPQDTLRAIHGKNGVTSLLSWDSGEGIVYSSGRDGCVRSLRVCPGTGSGNRDGMCCRLQPLTVTRVCGVSWVARLLCVSGKLLAVCFHGVKLRLWDVEAEQALMEVECGGAHRSWDLLVCGGDGGGGNGGGDKGKKLMCGDGGGDSGDGGGSGDEGKLVCGFLKDGLPYTFSTSLTDKLLPIIKPPFNSQETMDVCVLHHQGSDSLLVTAGEDTTLRLHSFNHRSVRRPLACLRSHLSGVRALCLIEGLGGTADNGAGDGRDRETKKWIESGSEDNGDSDEDADMIADCTYSNVYNDDMREQIASGTQDNDKGKDEIEKRQLDDKDGQEEEQIASGTHDHDDGKDDDDDGKGEIKDCSEKNNDSLVNSDDRQMRKEMPHSAQEEDNDTLGQDSGTLREDNGTLRQDSNTLGQDIGTPGQDNGTPEQDNGTLRQNNGTVWMVSGGGRAEFKLWQWTIKNSANRGLHHTATPTTSPNPTPHTYPSPNPTPRPATTPSPTPSSSSSPPPAQWSGGESDLKVTCREVGSHMLRSGTNKTWRHQQLTFDPETRYMAAEAHWVTSSLALVALASSDGFLRLFSFQSERKRERDKKGRRGGGGGGGGREGVMLEEVCAVECGCCLLGVVRVVVQSRTLLVTTTTRGHITFWNLEAVEKWLAHHHTPPQQDTHHHPPPPPSPQQLTTITTHQSGVNSITFHHHSDDPTHITMATGGDDNKISVWEVVVVVMEEEGGGVDVVVTRQCSVYGHASQVSGLAWLSGEHLLSVSIDQRLIIWNYNQGGGTREEPRQDRIFHIEPQELDKATRQEDCAISIKGIEGRTSHTETVEHSRTRQEGGARQNESPEVDRTKNTESENSRTRQKEGTAVRELTEDRTRTEPEHNISTEPESRTTKKEPPEPDRTQYPEPPYTSKPEPKILSKELPETDKTKYPEPPHTTKPEPRTTKKEPLEPGQNPRPSDSDTNSQCHLVPLAAYFTGVPDVKGLVITDTEGSEKMKKGKKRIEKRVFVYGMGMQVFDVCVDDGR